MVEIRTYDGDGTDAAELIGRVWRKSYTGKSWVTLWNRETLDWQVLSPRPAASELRLGAYDGTSLVGCMFADPFTFRIGPDDSDGALVSWLTVDTAADPQNLVAIRLVKEICRRLVEHGRPVALGYVIGDRTASAYRFWRTYSETFPRQCRFVSKLGYWVRVFDPRALAECGIAWFERLGGQLLRAWPWMHPAAPHCPGIREYAPADLPACLGLTEAMLAGVDLGLVWGAQRLAIQLRYEHTARTFVAEHEGEVAGFLSYHRAPLLGRQMLQAGMIDLMSSAMLTRRQRAALLQAAAHRMVEEGAQLAIMLRTAMCPTAALIASGFVPMPADIHLICLSGEPSFDLASPRRVNLILR